MCGYPANATGWIESGTTNTGLMSGLAPNTSYYYIFGDPSFGFSQEYSFVTGPVIGPNSSVAVLVNADPVRLSAFSKRHLEMTMLRLHKVKVIGFRAWS